MQKNPFEVDSDLTKKVTLTPEQELILKSGDQIKIEEEMDRLECKRRELAIQEKKIEFLLEYLRNFRK
ncbi:MAG: hypothetical protein A3H51_02730 [Candidatus Spechtbacteria bacterium RIFCSPLOWO2_02_FULL_38_8]|uniref:Uncharacterized protein n=1 Tax=Candidatus Spechtbacteria bacterium RIFCSPLOWO2_02_FULL_38_8 TaxID=1802164 RepID=A0A1G2HFQ4_9BACT|nr:MAG: hypothetical protein A3H51_02730 [Candidatus Spechtbacteria bacterium RIFCSPLOWO2_02_FULL_38_8]